MPCRSLLFFSPPPHSHASFFVADAEAGDAADKQPRLGSAENITLSLRLKFSFERVHKLFCLLPPKVSLKSNLYPDAFEHHGKSQHHENFWRRQLRRFLLEVIKIEAAA